MKRLLFFFVTLLILSFAGQVEVEGQSTIAFGNAHFSPFITNNEVNFTVCADNIYGRQVKVLVSRGDAAGYEAREWYLKVNYFVPGSVPLSINIIQSDTRTLSQSSRVSYSGTYATASQNGQTCLHLLNIDGDGPTFANTTYNYRVWIHGTPLDTPCGAAMLCGSDSR